MAKCSGRRHNSVALPAPWPLRIAAVREVMSGQRFVLPFIGPDNLHFFFCTKPNLFRREQHVPMAE